MVELPRRGGYIDLGDAQDIVDAYRDNVLKTEAERRDSIDYACPGDDPTCPGFDHGDPCHYRDEGEQTMGVHTSDCITNGFDMPGSGIIRASHCSCSLVQWVCSRCGLQRDIYADVTYVEHRCANGEIQSLDLKAALGIGDTDE